VTGGQPGHDSVLGLLTPGEVVLPVSLVRGIERLLKHTPASLNSPQRFAEGGRVSARSNNTTLVVQLAGPVPPSMAETQNWVLNTFAPAWQELQYLRMV